MPDGFSRVQAETAAKEKWALELGFVLQNSGYPIVLELQRTLHPQSTLVAQSGSDWPSTIRNRLGPFVKFANWLRWAKNRPVSWPYEVHDILDYLDVRFDEPCARTVPQTIISSLCYME